jgi:hypothetical protein
MLCIRAVQSVQVEADVPTLECTLAKMMKCGHVADVLLPG